MNKAISLLALLLVALFSGQAMAQPTWSATPVTDGTAGCVAYGDINGDLLQDVIVAGSDVSWFAAPSWTKTTVATPGTGQYGGQCEMADIDGDGAVDLVAMDGNALVWLKNNGTSPWTFTTIATSIPSLRRLRTADFDGDGLMDVAYRSDDALRRILFQNTPSVWTQVGPIGNSLSTNWALNVGDINGDGRPDLVGRSNWYLNPGGASARTAGNWQQGQFQGGLAGTEWSVFAYNFCPSSPDKDLVDIMLVNHTSGDVRFYKQSPALTFTLNGTATTAPNVVGTSHDHGYADGGGTSGIVVSTATTGFYVTDASGCGQFSNVYQDDELRGPHTTLADINNNGATEILAAGDVGGDTLRIVSNTTPFSTHTADTNFCGGQDDYLSSRVPVFPLRPTPDDTGSGHVDSTAFMTSLGCAGARVGDASLLTASHCFARRGSCDPDTAGGYISQTWGQIEYATQANTGATFPIQRYVSLPEYIQPCAPDGGADFGLAFGVPGTIPGGMSISPVYDTVNEVNQCTETFTDGSIRGFDRTQVSVAGEESARFNRYRAAYVSPSGSSSIGGDSGAPVYATVGGTPKIFGNLTGGNNNFTNFSSIDEWRTWFDEQRVAPTDLIVDANGITIDDLWLDIDYLNRVSLIDQDFTFSCNVAASSTNGAVTSVVCEALNTETNNRISCWSSSPVNGYYSCDITLPEGSGRSTLGTSGSPGTEPAGWRLGSVTVNDAGGNRTVSSYTELQAAGMRNLHALVSGAGAPPTQRSIDSVETASVKSAGLASCMVEAPGASAVGTPAQRLTCSFESADWLTNGNPTQFHCTDTNAERGRSSANFNLLSCDMPSDAPTDSVWTFISASGEDSNGHRIEPLYASAASFTKYSCDNLTPQISATDGWSVTQDFGSKQYGDVWYEFYAATTTTTENNIVGWGEILTPNNPAGTISAENNLAWAVRFNSSGNIDVQTGAGWTADVTYPYEAFRWYKFTASARNTWPQGGSTYSVDVSPCGVADPTTLATDLPMRYRVLDGLQHWAVYADVGGSMSVTGMDTTNGYCFATACGFDPTFDCAPAPDGCGGTIDCGATCTAGETCWGTCLPSAIQPCDNLVADYSVQGTGTPTFSSTQQETPQATGLLDFDFYARPSSSSLDTAWLMGATTPITDYSQSALGIRFSPAGVIQVRNGATYECDGACPTYTAGAWYHFVVSANISTDTYTVQVEECDSGLQTIATNFSFRQAVASLEYHVASAFDTGGLEIFGLSDNWAPGVCVPDTCAAEDCGILPDGCGGTLDCDVVNGTCEARPGGNVGDVCVSNLCCTPDATCNGGAYECGTPSDGCGSTQDCGTCTDPDVCQADFTCAPPGGNRELDAQGWSIINPDTDTRITYVANAGTDSSGCGTTTGNPCRTIHYAFFQNDPALRPRAGFADWVLLNKGDTFRPSTSETPFNIPSGRSRTNQTLLGAYGTGPRPVIEMANGQSFLTGNRQNIALMGIYFYSYTRDDTNPNWDGNLTSPGGQLINFTGMSVGNPTEGILIEDCRFSHFNKSLRVYSSNGTTSDDTNDIVFRRNVAHNNWTGNTTEAHAIYTRAAKTVIEENVFYHNGWRIQGTNGSSGPGGPAWIRTHNMYIAYHPSGTKINRNVLIDGSHNNIKTTCKSGSSALCTDMQIDNNLSIGADNPIDIGEGNPSTSYIRWLRFEVTNNVIMYPNRDNHTGRSTNVGWMIDALNAGEGSLIADNYLLNQTMWRQDEQGVELVGQVKNQVHPIRIDRTDGNSAHGNGTWKILRNTIWNLSDNHSGITVEDYRFMTGPPAEIADNTILMNGPKGIEDNQECFDIHEYDAPMTNITFSGNKCYSNNSFVGRLCTGTGNGCTNYTTSSTWNTATGDTMTDLPQDATQVFTDPLNANIESYLEQVIGIPANEATIEKYIELVLAQSKDNWDVRLTAPEVNTWIKANMAPLSQAESFIMGLRERLTLIFGASGAAILISLMLWMLRNRRRDEQ